jgi:hypothetical protein
LILIKYSVRGVAGNLLAGCGCSRASRSEVAQAVIFVVASHNHGHGLPSGCQPPWLETAHGCIDLNQKQVEAVHRSKSDHSCPLWVKKQKNSI